MQSASRPMQQLQDDEVKRHSLNKGSGMPMAAQASASMQ